MPGGSRRFTRSPRLTIAHSIAPPLIQSDMSSNKYSPLNCSPDTGSLIIDSPVAPKHFPFPNVPIDSTAVFETFMFIYSAVGCALQFLHLYRSVWWLPHSYNTQTVNFYLINGHLFIFIMTILSRRFIYMLGVKLLETLLPQHLINLATSCFRIILFLIIMGILGFCMYPIIQAHSLNELYCIFYLCYPIAGYFILFGITPTPFFDFVYCNENGLPPLHACNSNPTEIRQEVQNLVGNLNSRIKQVIFNATVGAYYAGLVPCCFVQNFVYYDVQWTCQHTFFLWVSSLISYLIHAIPLRYCDILHRSALHLGYWVKFESRPLLTVSQPWQDNVLWPPGISVHHGGNLYRSIGETNAAEPGKGPFKTFYSMFMNPALAFTVIMVIQIIVILSQISLLLNSFYRWYNILSTGLLLFFNYYILYKVGRDQRVSQKIYNLESRIHNKGSEN